MRISLHLVTNTGVRTLQQTARNAVTSPNSSTSTVILYRHGCDLLDDSNDRHFASNCTLACRQPGAVWESMTTLHNCLSYPTVSKLLADGELSAKDAELAANMGYLPATTANLSAITRPIDECMHAFCREETDSGDCYAHDAHQFDAEKFIQGACGHFKASPNVDVGGVGVYVGYIMQLSILIYAYIHTRLLATWIRAGTFTLHAPFQGLQRARQTAVAMQERLKKMHQQAALISGLVEFQRAQAFYSITLQAAAIASLAGTGRVFDTESYQQMHLTVSLLGDVAATGILCVVFGLYILHGWNKRSWYTTVLSLLAILISCVVWVQTRLPLRNLRELSPLEHDLPACGGRSPATFCLTRQAQLNTPLEATVIAICLGTTGVLIARQWQAYRRRTPNKQFPWRLELAEAGFAAMTAVMVYTLVSNGELAAMRQGVEWTFAQLISVTIWAPCIVEYLYAAVRKWSLGANAELQALFADEDSDEE